ncbi:hypothetical protein FJ951_26945 [Mesorhizobium sp. B2-2-3]|uniref:hypothetical protein n=1 Tax=Mesorhizobium sp. B2-2-3 TaxID=2589963 RepID=UPI00112C0336|nr:hypothetical protein [Mesorhizobium sp. B2-2-3]TPM39348.1 hypothetical protein FJ951_26945 [Mesorhizobium sp. B2-2-3]
MNAMTKSLAEAVEADLANVFPLKLAPRPNAEKLADLHRREAAACLQRVAEAKRALKADLAAFAAARKAEKARHEAEMTALAEGEAFARQRTAEAISDDEKLKAYNRAALDALA